MVPPCKPFGLAFSSVYISGLHRSDEYMELFDFCTILHALVVCVGFLASGVLEMPSYIRLIGQKETRKNLLDYRET